MKTIRDYLSQFFAHQHIQADCPEYFDVPVSSATWLITEGGGTFVHCGGLALISFQPVKIGCYRPALMLVLDDTAYQAWDFRRREAQAKGENWPPAPDKILRLVQTA